MRVGYLWLPHLPVQTARRRSPDRRDYPLLIGDLIGQPIGTTDLTTGGAIPRGRVVDASSDCLAAGVTVGMALREARELVPAAAILPADPDADAELLARALDLLERFSAQIEETAGEGAWFIPAPTDERRLGAALVDGLAAALGLEAAVALAPGKFVARLAAHRAAERVTLVSDAAAYLAPLPATLLPLAPGAQDRLKLLGITTVGAFAQLPVASVPRRFGPDAARAHQVARGLDLAPVLPRRHPEAPALRRRFEPTIEDRGVLLAVAKQLLDRLSRLLQERGQAWRALTVSVGLEDGRVVERRADLRTPTSDPRASYALLPRLIDALVIDRPVAEITLRVGQLGPEPARQEGLFEPSPVARRERVLDALTEIGRRYRGRLRRIVPGDDPSSLLDDRRLLLLPLEAPTEPLAEIFARSTGPAESAIRVRPVALRARRRRIFLVEPGAGPADEIVALHARWDADDWWPAAGRRTYYRVRTGRGRIATLARDHDQQRWLLIENFD
jgi:nucleotidyltransferase/DNA polymerase involved in DNA repair